jgi:hypothetical protein
MHLVEAVICLLQELLQTLEAACLQMCLIRVLVPNERTPEETGRLYTCLLRKTLFELPQL